MPSSSLVAVGESPPGPVPPASLAGAPVEFSAARGWPAKVPRRLPSGKRGAPATGFKLIEISIPDGETAFPAALTSGGGATGSAAPGTLPAIPDVLATVLMSGGGAIGCAAPSVA